MVNPGPSKPIFSVSTKSENVREESVDQVPITHSDQPPRRRFHLIIEFEVHRAAVAGAARNIDKVLGAAREYLGEIETKTTSRDI